mmetsp:Transcript_37978/g.112450  ORF Transcript_37978/g.112450 Transcript_37978/m.112450 type:complete len:225 (+) Transcript_37978:543-1217(+)
MARASGSRAGRRRDCGAASWHVPNRSAATAAAAATASQAATAAVPAAATAAAPPAGVPAAAAAAAAHGHARGRSSTAGAWQQRAAGEQRRCRRCRIAGPAPAWPRADRWQPGVLLAGWVRPSDPDQGVGRRHRHRGLWYRWHRRHRRRRRQRRWIQHSEAREGPRRGAASGGCWRRRRRCHGGGAAAVVCRAERQGRAIGVADGAGWRRRRRRRQPKRRRCSYG